MFSSSSNYSLSDFSNHALIFHRFQTRKLAWANAFSDSSSRGDLDILTQSGSMLVSQSRGGALPSGRLDILRLVDANAESPSKQDINGECDNYEHLLK
jgi:hypothetical protein